MSRKNILALLLALLLTVGQITPALAADTAAVMKLSATEGTVTVCNASARKLTVKDDMRLYSGYTVETAAKSYAWINLDDSKLVKLDASTKVEIRKSDKKLEVLVNSGNIYGDVSKKLDSDETLNIRTSTAVVGIRGTKFQVAISGAQHTSGSQGSGSDTASNGQTIVTCIEGSVTLTTLESSSAPGTTEPGTGEPSPGTETPATATQTVIVSAGQTATVTSTSSGAESTSNDVSVSLESAQQSDLTGSTQVELTNQGDYTMTPPGGKPITLTPDGAAAQQAADQRAAQQQAAENAGSAQTPAQSGTSQEVANPVWGGNTGNTNNTGNSGNSGNSGSSPGSDSSSGGSGSGGGSATPSTPGTPSVTTYTVTFDANGGAFNATSAAGGTTQTVKIVEAGGVPSFPEHPTRAGYEFNGWYTDESCTRYFESATPVTANTIVYAGWRLIEYKINLNGNGGNFDGSNAAITILTEHGQPLHNPPAPGRDGYSFAGWYTDSACTNAYDITADVTSDLTLYAKWIENTSAAKTYTATFVSNGGSAVDSKTIIEGAVFTPPTPPWWDYHTFGGWYTDLQCTEGNEYTFYSEASSDIILYAKWTEGVTITFDPNGGKFADGTSEPISVVTDVTGKLPSPLPELPVKTSYLCTGWYRGADLVDDEYAGTFKEAETLYANWAKPYTVTFNSNGGSAVETQTVLEGGKATRPADPTWDSHTFDSWYQDEACSYSREWNFDESTVDDNITLYAKWFGHDENLYLTSSDEANLDLLDRLMNANACKTIDLWADGDNTKLALGNQDLQIPDDKTLIVHADVVISGHITANGTLAMMGGEIYRGVTVEDGGTLNLSSGTVSGGVILKDSGKLNMSDGKITNSATSAAALTVKGTADGVDGNVNASITGGQVDGGDGIALYMISGAVSGGGDIVASQLKNVLQADSTDQWSLIGTCDNITDKQLYLGGKSNNRCSLYWVGPWNYLSPSFSAASGIYGTEAALAANYTGSINYDLPNDINMDLNGHSITFTADDSLTVGDKSILLTDSAGGGKFVVRTSNITLGSGTIKADQDGMIVLNASVTGYRVVKSGNYWELRQG